MGFLGLFIAILIGYLMGSIPFGYIVGKAHGIDITKQGSGSTGTTNALRLLGKKAAILVLLGDFLKGFFAPFVAAFALKFLGQSEIQMSFLVYVLACLSALIGHVKSCWIGFKGGKAVATGVGTLFALDWRVGLITAIIWALTVYISKYSSLGALIAVPLSPIFMYYFKIGNAGQWIYVGYCILGAAYIIYKHQANISRLLSGTEPKVGQKTN